MNEDSDDDWGVAANSIVNDKAQSNTDSMYQKSRDH